MPPRAPKRPASTASSSTTPTPTPWRRSCRRSTAARMATAARARAASGCRSRCFAPCAAASRDRFVVGCRYLADECIAGGSTRRRCRLLRRRVRARRHGLPVAVAWREVRGRQAAEGRLVVVSVHGHERVGVHADGAGGCARPVRPQRRCRRRAFAPPSARPAWPRPSSSSGGIHDFHQAEAILAAPGRGHRRFGAAVARRPRLVPQDRLGRGERSAALRVHQLLRGARPAPRR